MYNKEMKRRITGLLMAGILVATNLAGCGNAAPADNGGSQEEDSSQSQAANEETTGENESASEDSLVDMSSMEISRSVKLNAENVQKFITVPK